MKTSLTSHHPRQVLHLDPVTLTLRDYCGAIYLHHDWCGQGDRIICHPQGLPPCWGQTNLTSEREQEVTAALHQVFASNADDTDPDVLWFSIHPRQVLHLDPVTLTLLEVFPLH